LREGSSESPDPGIRTSLLTHPSEPPVFVFMCYHLWEPTDQMPVVHQVIKVDHTLGRIVAQSDSQRTERGFPEGKGGRTVAPIRRSSIPKMADFLKCQYQDEPILIPYRYKFHRFLLFFCGV
jgi:hypothetical protein